MVEDFRQALDVLGELPEEEQRQIEQREWDKLVSSHRSRAFLKRLIAEAKEGDIEEGGLELP